MPLLKKEQLLRKSKRTFKDVDFPELGGSIRVASLSAGSSILLNALRTREAKGEDVKREMMLALIQGSIIDENGQAMFDEASALEFFEVISLDGFNRLMAAAMPGTPAAANLGNSEASQSAA